MRLRPNSTFLWPGATKCSSGLLRLLARHLDAGQILYWINFLTKQDRYSSNKIQTTNVHISGFKQTMQNTNVHISGVHDLCVCLDLGVQYIKYILNSFLNKLHCHQIWIKMPNTNVHASGVHDLCVRLNLGVHHCDGLPAVRKEKPRW